MPHYLAVVSCALHVVPADGTYSNKMPGLFPLLGPLCFQCVCIISIEITQMTMLCNTVVVDPVFHVQL